MQGFGQVLIFIGALLLIGVLMNGDGAQAALAIGLLIVGGLAFWYGSSTRFQLKSGSKAFDGDQKMEAIRNDIRSVGMYDGSEEMRRKAEGELDLIERRQGFSLTQFTKGLYWEILKSESIAIPLAATYAIAFGEYLADPDRMQDLMMETQQNFSVAVRNAASFELLFPEYASLARKEVLRSDGNDHYLVYVMFMALSSNIGSDIFMAHSSTAMSILSDRCGG